MILSEKKCIGCKETKPLQSVIDQIYAEAAKKVSAKKRRRMKNSLKLNNRILSGIRFSLIEQKHGSRWESLVGYTTDQLKRHLERQFKDGMSWESFLKGEIHIDHIIPKSVFNFEKPEDDDFKRCWSLKNLQPLWAKDNIKKSNKLDKHFQPRLIF